MANIGLRENAGTFPRALAIFSKELIFTNDLTLFFQYFKILQCHYVKLSAERL